MSTEQTLRVETTGETVGEARWAALKELEQLAPGFDRDDVRFEILSEGERGLLGVGYAPARVVASLSTEAGQAGEETEAARASRELVARIASAIGARVVTTATEQSGVVTVTCSGEDLGLLIGKHGQTIDAIQYLANAVVRAEGADHDVVVDAAGYRDRRAASLRAGANRAARRAAASGRQVGLDPMTAVERKIVHEALKDDPEVETQSEGKEPNRYVVVRPRAASD